MYGRSVRVRLDVVFRLSPKNSLQFTDETLAVTIVTTAVVIVVVCCSFGFAFLSDHLFTVSKKKEQDKE